MNIINIQPLVGIDQVHFGAPRLEIHRALGPCSATFKRSPVSAHPTDAWLNNGIQVFYTGVEPIVEYIEFSSVSGFEAIVFGQSVFSTEASELVALIEKHAPFDSADPELGYSYIFPSLELSLWRPSIESPEGDFFSTIGVGAHGYFSR